MKTLKRYIPEGARDLLFEECSSKYEILNKLRNLYIGSGFLEISSPTLEFFDVFYDETIALEQERMYKLFDNRGRILVLRPDMTTPAARIAATKLKEAVYPLRVCYSGNIFRMNDFYEGKNSEITQSGIEIIGTENVRADSEVIITAIKGLLAIGLKNFQVELGQAEFFKGLIENLDLDNEQLDNLRTFIERKNFSALREFVEKNEKSFKESAQALKSLPELFGGEEIFDKARNLTGNKRALQAIENIELIYKNIESVGLLKHVSIDLGMIQHMDYYTGIIFRGYSSEIGSNILSGGRYDNLVSNFGSGMPATGFAINVDNAMTALKRQGYKKDEERKVLIHYSSNFTKKAYELVDNIRAKGVVAELTLFDREDKSLEYAKTKGFEKVIFIKENGTVIEEDLKTE
ncbi:ATP phosphoribosyltransferase regulatory subunit [Clostridium sp. SYSU_GA19001]|uniref:ATP phosphoribosyltransferase regulatory subunit n=1 Tax=Clostridium caldaquaticum TaxID=2940653 RepID=UPI002077433B|nr:ATP phosphoribosyltransferase regulatory subunit [Clostridium caldaquaticum]MCM8711444.1 ATP phosphoribosyltransferase regulatory subunit [Clostridium caldaquaticum]